MQLRDERHVAQGGAELANLVQRALEKLQSGSDIAALDGTCPIEAAVPGVPDGQRMPRRMIQQHRDRAFQLCQVADEERDRTGRRGQHVAQRHRVIERASVLNGALGGAHSLLRKPLKPKDACKENARGHSLVELKSDRMGAGNGGDVTIEHALDVASRLGLVSQIVQHHAEHPIADGGGQVPRPCLQLRCRIVGQVPKRRDTRRC